MEHFEKTLSSESIYKGRVIELRRDEVELENGSRAEREVIHHNGGVAVLALDDNGNALFVRQYRYPYGEVLLELPAGKLAVGEDPGDCGLRELREETGYIAGDYRFLGKVYPTPGYTDEILYLYVARDLVFAGQRLDEDEFLTVLKIPYKKAVEMCLSGEIKDAKTLIAILRLEAGDLRSQAKDSADSAALSEWFCAPRPMR